MDAAIYSLAGLVAVWLLRPALAQALRPGVPSAPDANVPKRARDRAVDDLEDQAGPYTRLATRIAELEHGFKLLSNEWQDKESRVDALLKRIHRLRKLEGDETAEQPSAPAQPLTREQVLAMYRAQQKGA